jgi:hypothetical protein
MVLTMYAVVLVIVFIAVTAAVIKDIRLANAITAKNRNRGALDERP